MNVLVTGGSGFVGGRLIRALSGGGHTVVGLARSDRAVAAVQAAGGTAVLGDLTDGPALRSAVTGADLVVHAAAKLTGGPREVREYQRVNVAGTAAVLAAATAADVPRVVYVSTEQVLMSDGPLVDADETLPYPTRSIGPYAATKQAAERAVLDAGGVAVRPRMIWGAGDTTLLPAVVEAARTGRLRWIGGGHQLTSTCHVDNAVEGILAAAERARPGEAYFLTDGDPVEFRAFWTDLLDTQGIPAPAGTLPRWLARAAAVGAGAVWRGLRLRGEPPLDRMTVSLLADECTVDDTKARRELGYRARTSREDGMAGLRA